MKTETKARRPIGRPAGEGKFPHKVFARISDEDMRTLRKIEKKEQCDTSEAIRFALEKVREKVLS